MGSLEPCTINLCLSYVLSNTGTETEVIEEQTERLAAEVASLREALQKLLNKLDV